MVFGWDPKPLKVNMVMALGLCVKWPWIWVSLHMVSHPMIIFPKPTERKHNRLIMLYAPLVSERLVGPNSKREPNSKMPPYIHLLHFHTHFYCPNLNPSKTLQMLLWLSLHMNRDLMNSPQSPTEKNRFTVTDLCYLLSKLAQSKSCAATAFFIFKCLWNLQQEPTNPNWH